MFIDRLTWILILFFTWPLRYLPYTWIHGLGKPLGLLIYYCVPKYRKRTLSNLSLASTLCFSESELKHCAKRSLQNLAITCLEYAKLASETQIERIAHCENPEVAEQLIRQGKPVIFFCGHQANWEMLFLEGTQRMPGVAIGRPIKNSFLYTWILRIRQKYGGKIIPPHNAIREGLRGLKRGAFLGIVGDQGMPDSGYRAPFLGRHAFTSPIAALLAYRTLSPMIVATTRRAQGKYIIHYSDPIWPNPDQPLEKEVDRLMSQALQHLETAIITHKEQWLWSHNRWKQQTPGRVKKQFRHESILLILPQTPPPWLLALSVFKEIYPTEFFTVYAPATYVQQVDLKEAEIIPYTQEQELFKRDFRFKLVFNFTPLPALSSHFRKLSTFTVLSLDEIIKDPRIPFSEQLKQTLLSG